MTRLSALIFSAAALVSVSAFAGSKSPEQLASDYQAAFVAKDCARLTSLWDAPLDKLTQESVCAFSGKSIGSAKVAPVDPEMSKPNGAPGKTYAWSLPLVNQLEITYLFNDGSSKSGGALFFIGKKGDEYFLSTLVEKK